MTYLIVQTLNGLFSAALLFLIASGLTLAFWRDADRQHRARLVLYAGRLQALVGVVLWIVNDWTLIGARVRAAVDDPEIAAATGINVVRLPGGVCAAGAALATFGGVMGGPILGGYTGMDFDLLPLAFVVVIVGGLGSLKGALIGAITSA